MSLTPEPQVEASGSAESPDLDASGLPAPPPDANEDTSPDTGSGGAFNPVTGEINWDCPCLGGMAHGPCGPQFREAFSCFVFSEEEPKGINCVEMFKAMQTCFREHPEIYGDGTCRSVVHQSYLYTNSDSEIDDDEDEQPVPTSTEDADIPPSTTGDIPEKPVESASTVISKPQTQAHRKPQSQVQASPTH
jgi:intermembrane space import and assembly protein 40